MNRHSNSLYSPNASNSHHHLSCRYVKSTIALDAHLHPAPKSFTTKARLPVKNSMLSFLKSHGILKTLQPMLTPKPISAPTTQKEPIPIALRRLKLRRFPSARSQSFPDPSNVPLVLPAPFRKSFLDPSNVLLDQLTLFP